MAVLTPVDASGIINLIYKQACGITALSNTDVSDFTSMGEKILSTGRENVLNSISIVMGRLIVASRPYEPKFQLIEAVNTEMYSNRLRKLSFYTDDALEAGHVNTNLKVNLKDGFDNGSNGGQSTASMWEQHYKDVVEVDFGNSLAWQYCMTRTDNQLKMAFRDEAEFTKFIEGYIQECGNDIAQEREAFNRMCILAKIASTIDMAAVMDGSAVNLKTAFNNFYNTNYSVADLLSTHFADFMAFFVSEFKQVSDFMTNRTARYHWTMDKNGKKVLRATPKSQQAAILYGPILNKARALVQPNIFHNELLELSGYESTDGWQVIGSPAIDVTPALPDYNNSNNGEQVDGARVQVPYVLGMIFDKDGLMTDFQYENSQATPMEARKHFYNIWYSFNKGSIVDQSENCCVFYLMD